VRVWITRAQPGAEATAQRLRALGHAPIMGPLLTLRALDGVSVDLDGVGALAFTSVNAVPLFAALCSERRLPVFAVGEATALVARAAGFSDVWSADGDVDALSGLIASTWRPDRGAVLHAGAREPAGDLSGTLAAAGVRVRGLPVYDTEAVSALPIGAAAVDGLDAVLIHSPKAGRALARLAVDAPHLRTLRALALSDACAAPLRQAGFTRVEAAEFPKEAALLKLLSTMDAPAQPLPPVDAPPHGPEPETGRKRLGWTFWAGILFGLVCIFLGAVVGIWGSRIFPPPLEPPPAVMPAEPPPAGAPGVTGFDPASDTYALEQRLAQVEAEAAVRGEAAAAALAVANLTQAAEGSAPFADQIQAYAGVLPSTPDTEALRALAAVGAPTLAELTARFPDAAARAAAAQRQAEAGEGIFARLVRVFASVVAVRRVDRLEGPGADAVLARAERAVGRGDLAAAVRELGTLPPAARTAADEWRDQAARRHAINVRLDALRAAALARLPSAQPATLPEQATPPEPAPEPAPEAATEAPGVLDPGVEQ